MLNASVRGNEVIYRKQINIGIAVALDWGLIVPVIKNADNLSLTGLTRSLNDLANRARTKRLDPREVQDGTFTITNPGVFGSLIGTPIINQPQVGILCIGAIEKRPKVLTGPDGEDTIAIRTCAYLSLSFDHRIVDGADADKFMALRQEVASKPSPRRCSDRCRALSPSNARSSRRRSASSSRKSCAESTSTTRRQNCRFWVFEEAALPGRIPRVLRGRRRRRRWRARHAAAPEPVLDPQPRLHGSGVALDAIARSITIDGKSWLVFPSGRVTQYDRDEFGLIFINGTRQRPRGARHALLAGRHALARTVARRDDRRRSRALFEYSQPSDTSPEADYSA